MNEEQTFQQSNLSRSNFHIWSPPPHFIRRDSWFSTFATDGNHIFRIDCFQNSSNRPTLTVWPLSVRNCSYHLDLPENSANISSLSGFASFGNILVGFANGTVARYVVGTSKVELQVSVSLFNGIVGFYRVEGMTKGVACIDALGGVTVLDDLLRKLLKIQPKYLLNFSKTHLLRFALENSTIVCEYVSRDNISVHEEKWDVVTRSFVSSATPNATVIVPNRSMVKECEIFFQNLPLCSLFVPLVNNYMDEGFRDMISNLLLCEDTRQCRISGSSTLKVILSKLTEKKLRRSVSQSEMPKGINYPEILLFVDIERELKFCKVQAVCLDLLRRESARIDKRQTSVVLFALSPDKNNSEHIRDIVQQSTHKFWSFYLFSHFYPRIVSHQPISQFNDLFFKFYKLIHHNDELGQVAMLNLLVLGSEQPGKFAKRLATVIKESNDSKLPLMLVRRLLESNILNSLRNLPTLMELVVLPCLEPMNMRLRKHSIDPTTEVFKLMNKLFPMTSFHQGRQKFAIGTTQGVVHVYDLRTACKWRRLEGHTGAISATGFEGGSGKHLCSYSATDCTVRIWQLGSGGTTIVINANQPTNHSLVSSLAGLIGNSGGKCLQIKQLGPADDYPDALSHPFNLIYRIHGVKIRWTSPTDVLLVRENGAGVQIKL